MKSLKEKENLHVVFWLVKDFAWLMHFRELGMAMALPTIALSKTSNRKKVGGGTNME